MRVARQCPAVRGKARTHVRDSARHSNATATRHSATAAATAQLKKMKIKRTTATASVGAGCSAGRGAHSCNWYLRHIAARRGRGVDASRVDTPSSARTHHSTNVHNTELGARSACMIMMRRHLPPPGPHAPWLHTQERSRPHPVPRARLPTSSSRVPGAGVCTRTRTRHWQAGAAPFCVRGSQSPRWHGRDGRGWTFCWAAAGDG